MFWCTSDPNIRNGKNKETLFTDCRISYGINFFHVPGSKSVRAVKASTTVGIIEADTDLNSEKQAGYIRCPELGRSGQSVCDGTPQRRRQRALAGRARFRGPQSEPPLGRALSRGRALQQVVRQQPLDPLEHERVADDPETSNHRIAFRRAGCRSGRLSDRQLPFGPELGLH